ncbi:MAG: hypothetical protein ACOX3T_06155 [Bdellovibrionota bacterium]
MNTDKIIKKYWIMGFPYFESRLFFVPNDIGRNYESLVKMKLYDPDGALINEIKMLVSSKCPLILDLENFMGDCKPESGIKYGLLVCEMDEYIDSYLRFQTKKTGVFVGELNEFNNKAPLFFPVYFSKERNSVLMLRNSELSDVKIEYKILKDNRAPVKTITLQKMHSRIIFLNNAFKELVSDFNEKDFQAYLRLSCVEGDSVVGAQIIDYNANENLEGDFSSIA